MVRLERDDSRLMKKPLLFLVGETRRDIIPRTLMDEKLGEEMVEVEELEVYSTRERKGFGEEFGDVLEGIRRAADGDGEQTKNGSGRDERRGKAEVVVVVVFSPQGCESMLRGVGFVDAQGRVTEEAKRRWEPDAPMGDMTRFVIATIGPTTRDHLEEKFGFGPDICAKKPSPEGVGEGIKAFLQEKVLT